MIIYEVGLEMDYEGTFKEAYFLHEKDADAYHTELRNELASDEDWSPMHYYAYKIEINVDEGEHDEGK